jgi:hypothetical protein
LINAQFSICERRKKPDILTSLHAGITDKEIHLLFRQYILLKNRETKEKLLKEMYGFGKAILEKKQKHNLQK